MTNPLLASCSHRARLPARNGLVNEVEFLGLIPQNGGRPMDCEIANYYVALLTTFKFIHLHSSIRAFI